MIVRASLLEDYTFAPLHSELAQFANIWKGKVAPVAGGYTLRGYAAVPEFTVKGEVVLTATATRTAAFPTKAATLHELKRAISPLSGEVLDASAGLSVPVWKIGRTALGYEANHLPVIMGVYPVEQMPDRVCIAVNGNYDLQTGLFNGLLDFVPLGEVWKG